MLKPWLFQVKGRLRNGYLGTRNRNFHRRESNVSTRRRWLAECPLASGSSVNYTKKKEQIGTFFSFSSKMDTVTRERRRSLEAPKENYREAIWGKAHTFTWIFPGCTEYSQDTVNILFCSRDHGTWEPLADPQGAGSEQGVGWGALVSFPSASHMG